MFCVQFSLWSIYIGIFFENVLSSHYRLAFVCPAHLRTHCAGRCLDGWRRHGRKNAGRVWARLPETDAHHVEHLDLRVVRNVLPCICGLLISHHRWYFDAISQTTDASITVVFYNSGPDGFVNDYLSGPFSVALNGAFENGTVFNIAVDSTGGLILDYESTDGSITGQWIGADNVSFTGTALTDYTIDIDAPGVGVTGSITFQSVRVLHSFP